MEALQVEPVTEKDADDIIAMLKKSFFLHETLNASIGLADADGNCPELERYCVVSIPAGLGLQARDPASGDIMGVVLNGILERSEGPRDEDCRVRPGCTKFDKILAINHAAEREGNLFKAYPAADRALDVHILATNPAHTKKGVAKTLMQHTLDLARSKGFSLVRCICSGAFSAKVVEHLGFTFLGMIRYEDFLDTDGLPVFKPPPPHEGVSVWALQLT